MKYILVNIGCIECGVSTQIVGVFYEKKDAEDLCNILLEKGDWRQGGQNGYQVFELKDGFWVNQEYVEIANS